jgi:ribosomal protein L37AE/L43A
MKRSESNKELASALAKAAANFPPIERNCTAKVQTKSGGQYSYDYADLDAVLSAVRKPLAEQGLTISHDCVVVRGQDGSLLGVETTATLLHASDEWREGSPLFLPAEPDSRTPPAQQIGGLATYGKRYTTQDLLGLSTKTGQRAAKPVCPECGKSTFVYEDKKLPGAFYCWKKPDSGKHGCGNQWSPEAEVDQERRASVFALLEKAASEGQDAFASLWKGLAEEDRKSVAGDLEALKEKIVKDPALAAGIAAWRKRLDPETMNLTKLNELIAKGGDFYGIADKPLKEKVWPMVLAFAKENGCTYDTSSKKFVETSV